jgi:NAD(P)-dependent dehydrogenase (short-subunit alcohol dehydrogenase family)
VTEVTILTGASRGLGLGIAELLLERGHRLLTIQRRPNLALDGESGRCEQWAVDLAEPAPVADRLADWIAALPAAETSALTLINNAALLARPATAAASDPAELAAALRVGLEAPLLLTAAFLRASAAMTVPRKVLNISSGLGRSAMAGSASYCAVKAGLDHLSRAIALEEAGRPNGARICALAPGVIDTDMQLQLRGADAAAFPERQRFVALHDSGQLARPRDAAERILRCLDRADFGANPIGDVRDV